MAREATTTRRARIWRFFSPKPDTTDEDPHRLLPMRQFADDQDHSWSSMMKGRSEREQDVWLTFGHELIWWDAVADVLEDPFYVDFASGCHLMVTENRIVVFRIGASPVSVRYAEMEDVRIRRTGLFDARMHIKTRVGDRWAFACPVRLARMTRRHFRSV